MILSINSQGINWWNQGHLKQFYQVIPRECVYRIHKKFFFVFSFLWIPLSRKKSGLEVSGQGLKSMKILRKIN